MILLGLPTEAALGRAMSARQLTRWAAFKAVRVDQASRAGGQGIPWAQV